MFLVVVYVVCFSCWLCCCRASWANVGLVVDVPLQSSMCCVSIVGSVVAGLLGLLLGWLLVSLVGVHVVLFGVLALLLQGFLGYCWAGC
jgi:hypothetical protein